MDTQSAARRFVLALLLGGGAASSSAWAQAGCTPESIFDLFRASVEFEGGDAASSQVSTGFEIGDLNNDGWPDIVLSNEQSGDLSVILADGNEGFLPPVRLALDPSGGNLSQDVSLGDVNNDSALDIIALAGNLVNPRLFLNNGDGTFAPYTEVNVIPPSATFPVPTDVGAADMDLDGNVDLVFVRLFGGSVVAWGLGNGQFEPPVIFANLDDLNARNQDLNIADFDGDGLPDIGVDGTAILVNQGSRSFAAPPQGPFNTDDIDETSLADLNGDGLLDVILVERNVETAYAIATSPTTFSPFIFFSVNQRPSDTLRAADIDGDGDVDLVGGGRSGQPNEIGIRLNNGDATFQPIAYLNLSTFATTARVRSVRLADMDRRGSPDAIVQRDDGQITVLRNTCLFRPVITQQPQAIAVGVGQPASFTATLAVELAGFTYQWLRDGVPLADAGGISGATSPTLSILSATTDDIGLYTLEIMGDAGVAISTPAALAVVPSEGLVPGDFNSDGVASEADVLDLINEIQD